MARRAGTLRLASFFALSAAAAACATVRDPGVYLETVSSKSLRKPARYLVLKPPSYETAPSRRYPVLYFLHDGYGTEATLARRGIARELFDRMRDGRLPEFLVVAPGGRGTWFSDFHDGSLRYEEFLAGDLIEHIGSRYRVVPGKAGRGITGISMGAYAAVKTALKHPDLFGSVSSLSGPLVPISWEDLERYGSRMRSDLRRIFGDSPQDNSLAENDVWELARGRFEASPFAVRLMAGTEDPYGLAGVAAQFGTFLNDQGISTTVVLSPGEHRWSYWGQALIEVCGWHANRFSYDSP